MGICTRCYEEHEEVVEGDDFSRRCLRCRQGSKPVSTAPWWSLYWICHCGHERMDHQAKLNCRECECGAFRLKYRPEWDGEDGTPLNPKDRFYDRYAEIRDRYEGVQAS